jgi:polynucleotide 5'-hydroxyl-kinase GRC3/NOL9
MAVSESIAFPDLLKALDVSIVGLREEDNHQEMENGLVEAGQSMIATLHKAYEKGFQQNTSQCVGLGLIRAIDTKAQTAHIITPLSPAELSNVNAVTKGDIELPTVMMVDYISEGGAEDSGLAGVEWKKVPYLEHGENLNTGVGHGRRKVRRNVMRRSQFK